MCRKFWLILSSKYQEGKADSVISIILDFNHVKWNFNHTKWVAQHFHSNLRQSWSQSLPFPTLGCPLHPRPAPPCSHRQKRAVSTPDNTLSTFFSNVEKDITIHKQATQNVLTHSSYLVETNWVNNMLILRYNPLSHHWLPTQRKCWNNKI